MDNHIDRNLIQGAVVSERFATITVPKSIKERVAAFLGAHKKLEASSGEAETAKAACDQASKGVRTSLVALETACETFASKLVGAGLGKRRNPFAGYSKETPGSFSKAAFAKQPEIARDLVAAVRAGGKLPAAVDDAADVFVGGADDVDAALKAITPAELAYQQALAARDADLATWRAAYTKLKNGAKLAWEEAPATYAAVFAPPEPVRAPKRRRKAATATAPAAATASASASAPASAPAAGSGTATS